MRASLVSIRTCVPNLGEVRRPCRKKCILTLKVDTIKWPYQPKHSPSYHKLLISELQSKMAASDYADTDNVTTAGNGSLENVTSADDVGGGGPIPLTRIFVCLVLFVIVIVTILGNIVVIAAFVIEKKLRTTFTFYILNLAITDILVAVTAMSFYTFDILLGWWPFGQVTLFLVPSLVLINYVLDIFLTFS